MIMFGPTIDDVGELYRATDRNYVIVGDYPWGGTGQPAPKDDPQSPAPSPVAQGWQCPGCGTIYSYLVNKCECQRRGVVSSSASTNGTFTTELP